MEVALMQTEQLRPMYGTQVSGPSTATFSATNTACSTVSNLVAGLYTFRLDSNRQ